MQYRDLTVAPVASMSQYGKTAHLAALPDQRLPLALVLSHNPEQALPGAARLRLSRTRAGGA